MRQNRGQVDDACGLIDRRGLDSCDLMLAQGLAHDLKAAGERGIAEQPLRRMSVLGFDRTDQRLFRILKFDLCLGQRRSQRSDGFTLPLHGLPPPLWR